MLYEEIQDQQLINEELDQDEVVGQFDGFTVGELEDVIRPFDADHNELIGLRILDKEDKEIERYYWFNPDTNQWEETDHDHWKKLQKYPGVQTRHETGGDHGHMYMLTSGNETVPGWSGLEPWMAQLAEDQGKGIVPSIAVEGGPAYWDYKRSEGGWSDIEPEWIPQFYSAQRPWKEQYRNYNLILMWVLTHQDNKDLLRAGWNRFWKRYHQEKGKGTLKQWLTQNQINCVKHAFQKLGITFKSAR